MLAFLLFGAQVVAQPAINITDVFVSGSLDASQPYAVFRIPAICRTGDGTLLAFAEARRSIADQSFNQIVMRRLLRNSKTWTPVQVVIHDEPASLNNPCVLATAKTIWMMYQRYPKGLHERTVLPEFDPNTSCRSFVISSKDDAQTWSAPRELTQIVKRAEIQTVASGPGIGIELSRGPHKGRLLFPFNEGSEGMWSAFSVFSDDQGKSWKRGPTAAKADGLQPNETQFAELSDGRVLLNARNQAAGRYRLMSTSHDGGGTWEMIEAAPSLPDPVCQGSILRLSFSPNILAFSNPADKNRRMNGTVRLSRDDGKSWSSGAQIMEGSFEYSCLSPVTEKSIGVLFETKEVSPSGKEGYRIRFRTMDVGALSAPTGAASLKGIIRRR